MLAKTLPFDIFFRPNGQQENWMRTGKYTPEVPHTQEQMDFHKAIDYSFLEEAALLQLAYDMGMQACKDLKEKDLQEYNQRIRTAKKLIILA